MADWQMISFPCGCSRFKSSSFVFDGFFCPSDPFARRVAAAAGMSDGFKGDREKWAESFFGRSAESRSRMRGEGRCAGFSKWTQGQTESTSRLSVCSYSNKCVDQQ